MMEAETARHLAEGFPLPWMPHDGGDGGCHLVTQSRIGVRQVQRPERDMKTRDLVTQERDLVTARVRNLVTISLDPAVEKEVAGDLEVVPAMGPSVCGRVNAWSSPGLPCATGGRDSRDACP